MFSKKIFYRKDYDNGMVIAGIKYLDVENNVLKEGEELIFTGWSQGTTPAILAAEEMFVRTRKVYPCVTFGGPKVCYNKATALYLSYVVHK